MYEIFLYTLFFFSLIAVVITSGVVLRVEKQLDVSYKFLLAAMVVFSLGILIDILLYYEILPKWQWSGIIKTVFLIFFTLGVFEMRTLIINLENKDEDRRREE